MQIWIKSKQRNEIHKNTATNLYRLIKINHSLQVIEVCLEVPVQRIISSLNIILHYI